MVPVGRGGDALLALAACTCGGVKFLGEKDGGGDC